MLRAVCHTVVIVAACVITGAKLRSHGGVSPLATTQELNRCLSLIRAASSRSTPTGSSRRHAYGMYDR